MRRWFQRSATPAVPAVEVVRPPPNANNELQIVAANELVQHIALEPLLCSIRRLVALPTEHWNALYQPVLNHFLEACQLAPASMAHHHAGPGGLAAHTLESVEIALQLRKPLILPQRADPDTSARQEHIWTYAIFLAVLLHDVGKLNTTTRIRLGDGQYLTPYTRLAPLIGKRYTVEFESASYKLHTRIAAAYLHLVPKTGMEWLSKFPEILSNVCAHLYGDPFEAGIIGELAQKSDGISVARNLKNGGDRIRFHGAPTIPLIDRLIIGLRQMLEYNELKLNSNGADGWCDEHYIWLVCGTVAKKLIEHLQQSGMTNIPTDNNRIFDTLQEHGFIVPAPNGKAIWHTHIAGPNGSFHFNLTMLKFEISRLIPSRRRPAPFTGTIEDIDSAIETETTPKTPAPEVHTTTTTAPEPLLPSALPVAPVAPAITTTPPVEQAQPSNLKTASTATETAGTRAKASLSFDDIRPRHIDDDIGQKFMDWLARRLRAATIPINQKDAPIHTVPEGVLVVSPRVFREFIDFFGLRHRENGTEIPIDDAIKHVQKKLEKLRQNIRSSSGMNVHTYTINGANRTSKVSGFLFDTSLLFGHVTVPPPNPLLQRHAKTGNWPKKSSVAGQ
ncbi:conserved hypothetical protein [gamma proteobacterium HdN1]|nr:Conserved hypothetical protein [gamma proteobacterium HdN1]CBL47078.1 conserved hypothetical protein [gamma proteobacterium HdN1]